MNLDPFFAELAENSDPPPRIHTHMSTGMQQAVFAYPDGDITVRYSAQLEMWELSTPTSGRSTRMGEVSAAAKAAGGWREVWPSLFSYLVDTNAASALRESAIAAAADAERMLRVADQIESGATLELASDGGFEVIVEGDVVAHITPEGQLQ